MESARQGGAGRRHKAVGMLEGMDVQVVAFIALRKVLDTFSQSMPYQRVSILVGREVENGEKADGVERSGPRPLPDDAAVHRRRQGRKYRRTVLNYAFGKSTTVEYEPWAEADALHLGQKLIELAMESCRHFPSGAGAVPKSQREDHVPIHPLLSGTHPSWPRVGRTPQGSRFHDVPRLPAHAP